VETSGGRVKIGSGTVITTRAPSGTSGTWLIDPDGYTIAASGGDIDGTTLGNNVDNNGDTIISSTDGSGSDGNINVNDNVTWHANNLSLIATNDININAVMTAGAVDDTGNPGTFASLDLEPGSGTVNVGFNPDGTFKGRVDFFQADGVTPRSGTGFLTINGNDYTVITDLGAESDDLTGTSTLQGMAYGGNSSGYFALGSTIDATDTSGWNYGEGFVPVGTGGYSFTGTFDGLGHTISNLTINRPSFDNQGLFGNTNGATLRNVGLTAVNVTGYGKVGALVGYGYGTAIMNSYVTGSVTGDDTGVGGLMGYDYGGSSIINSHASATVAAGVNSTGVGGLMGYGYGSGSGSTILDSHATGNVTGGNSVGGLVGYGYDDSITNSYATGEVTGTGDNVGGLVGYTNGSNPIIDNSYATGPVTGNNYVGGLVGYVNSGSITISNNSHADGLVTGNSYVGGLVGSINSGGTINISDAYAIGGVKADTNPNGQYIGGLVGYLYGGYGSTLSNSYANGAVTAGDSSSAVGGLVGYSDSVAITNSHAAGNVTAGPSSDSVGGLVGSNYNSPISGSFASGTVSADAATSQNVGGLVGYNNFGSSIDNSYASGPVTGNSYVGGLIGIDNSNTITNAYASGAVTGSSNVGGLVGNGSGSSVNSSFWDRTVNADPALDNGFGTGKTTTELKTLATFTDAGWDIDDAGGTGSVWRIYDGNTMPLLRGFLTPLTITATPVTKTYDGTAYTGDLDATYSDPTAPASGHLQGLTSPYASFVNAGTYSPSPPYSDQLGYDITASGDSGLTITPAPLSITASDASKSYGQTSTLSAFTSSGLQNGETIGSVTLASTGSAATAGVSGSPYTITASNATGGTFSAGNYTITYNNGALTITPVALSITASDASKSYGQTPTLSAFTSSGLQNSETIGSVTLASAGTAATAGVSGSPYTITASNATGGTFSAGNYTITYSNGALTITPAALSITASDASKSYGQTTTFTGTEFTSSGLQNGETIGSVTLSSAGTAATAGVSGSPYAITASNATGGTFSAGNYTITHSNGALTITPAALFITADDASKTNGQTVTFTGTEFTSSGLRNSETIGSVTLDSAGAAASASAAGSPYAITASNATGGTFNADNYAISYNDGALTVSAESTASTEPTVVNAPIQPPVPTPPAVSSQGAPLSIPQPPAPIVDHTGSGTSAGTSGGIGGPSVTLLSEPTSQSSGIIAVTVPDSMAQPGSAFSFQLPEQVRDMAAATATAVTVSLSDGGQVPGWLQYSPESNTFTASDVPAGSLPIKIIVTVGDQSWTVEITKQQA